jgi:hypothetical protein
MKKRKPAEVASQEAFEEAGLIGHIAGKRPDGSSSGWRHVGLCLFLGINPAS